MSIQLPKKSHKHFKPSLAPDFEIYKPIKVRCAAALTVDVHPDGLDGGRPQAVLSLAVVAPPLGPQDLCDVQRLVEHAGVLEAVRHAAGRLGPSDLRTEKKKKKNLRNDE